MSTFSHKHTTRLKTGVLKRKYLREDYSDASCNDSSSGSDFESDDESSSEPDDMENNEHVEKCQAYLLWIFFYNNLYLATHLYELDNKLSLHYFFLKELLIHYKSNLESKY